MIGRYIAVSVLVLALVPAVAPAATVERDSTSGVLTIIGQSSDNDDLTVVREGTKDIVSHNGGTLTTSGPGCAKVDETVECDPASSIAVDLGAGNDTFRAPTVGVPTSVAGGDGNDDIHTGGHRDVLAGGAGNDTLDGGPDIDEYFGEAGDDTINARDGHPERIACGAGPNDVANNDFIDIIAECERGVDTDRDGFSTAVDCNDSNAAIFPGAREVFSNGVDENCNGRDDANLDVDGDGFPTPQDCNDANAKIRPTAREIRGNRTDENCDHRALPFADLGAVVANQWAFAPGFSRLLKLVVHTAPKGAKVTFRCRGRSCPSKKTRKRTSRGVLRPIVLHRPFRGRRLAPGTRLTVRITARQTIGRTYTYTVKRGAPPETKIVCQAPGSRKRRSC